MAFSASGASSNHVEVGGYTGQRGGEGRVNRRGGDTDFKENMDWHGGTVVMQRRTQDGGGGYWKCYAAADVVKPTYSQINQPRGVLNDLRGHVTVPSPSFPPSLPHKSPVPD